MTDGVDLTTTGTEGVILMPLSDEVLIVRHSYVECLCPPLSGSEWFGIILDQRGHEVPLVTHISP